MRTLSIRIPNDIIDKLDRATKGSGLSRSRIVRNALDKHLPVSPQNIIGEQARLEILRRLMGAGARRHGALSAEQIDADLDEVRGRSSSDGSAGAA